jgi:hypothetical protein
MLMAHLPKPTPVAVAAVLLVDGIIAVVEAAAAMAAPVLS